MWTAKTDKVASATVARWPRSSSVPGSRRRSRSARTYAERTAETVAKVKAATIEAIAQLGFRSATTAEIARRTDEGVLRRSLRTTNCLESINGLVEHRTGKIDYWKNSSQKHRWLATALLDIEPRLRRIKGYRHLPVLRGAMQAAMRPTVKEAA